MGHDAAWHAKRREGIGGSDIAAIFGLSSWKKPLDIYRLKTGMEGPSNAGAAAARGSRLEGAVIKRFVLDSGMPVTDGHDFLRHHQWPRVRLQANTDGTIPGDDPGVFEAKTTTRHSRTADTLYEDMIPIYYATQVQGYLAATDYSWGVLAAMVGPAGHNEWDPHQCDLLALRFERNDTAIQIIEEVVEEFWAHVDDRRPPRWTRHNLVQDLLQALRWTEVERVL